MIDFLDELGHFKQNIFNISKCNSFTFYSNRPIIILRLALMKNPCFIKSNFIFRWSGPKVDYLDFYSNHSNVIPNLPFKIRFYLWLKSIFLTLYLFLKMKMMLAFLKPTKTISFGHFCFNQTVKHYWFAVVVRCWVLWFDLIQTLLQDSWAYFDKMVRSKTIRYYTINQWINKVCQIFLGASRRLKKTFKKFQ